jgi:hypothetical protein
MTDKELAIRIVQMGVATQRSASDSYTQANDDVEVRNMGNAAIANSLEFLGKHGLVKDVQCREPN